ncbi:MAG: hypothetical protein IT184_13385 [Acidobacteria bacterium]|nr:hypothetical protein [Acidobacteriota bacterium]
MKVPRSFLAILLRLYPKAWRQQYGDELLELLERRPLSLSAILDVLRAALWQRMRAVAPSTLLGVACLLLIGAGVIVTPTAYGQTSWGLVRASNMTFPPIKIVFFESELFALLLVGCGCWTQLARGTGPARAAMWMTIVAGLPVLVGGVLIGLGVLDAAFPLSTGQLGSPSPWAMVLAPFVRAPESAIWGAIGGRLGRWIARRRGSPVSA